MTSKVKPTQFDAVFIGSDDALNALVPLVRTAGGNILQRLGWYALDELDCVASGVVIVIDLRDTEAVVRKALDKIQYHIDTTECSVVGLLDQKMIDLCTGLHSRGVQLLCDPEDAEIVAALAIAGGVGAALHDVVEEGKLPSLDRLNHEVAKIARMISQLNYCEVDLKLTDDLQHDVHDDETKNIEIDPADIRRVIRTRTLRNNRFGTGLFEDPAWDMMLDLFAAELEHRRVSTSSLCIAARVAPTTALRWINRLVDAGLFHREADPLDRRRAFIELSERASAEMRRYVAEARAAGLSIA